MNRKNLEKVIMLSLVLSSIGSGSAMAWEWGLNNSGGTVDIPESSKSFIVNSMTDKAIGIFNAQSGTLTTNHILLEVRSANKEATGFFNDGGSTYTGKDIYMTVVGGTGDYMVQGIANQSTGADGTSKFAAGDIRMDLTGYGSKIYGIINGSHGTNGNNAVDFKAGDIIIEANNDGNVIGITNKNGTNGGSTFSADNVSIDASGKWFMAGIENQTSNQMDLKNVYINLIKKENGVMYGVLNTGVDFKSERLSILLDNDKGTDKTIGIDVGGYKTIINDDLNLRIIGNANSNVIGVKGEAQVAGNVYADLSGGKNVTGIHGTANIDGSVDMKINSLGSAYGINAGQVTVGHNMNMDITGKDGVVAGISSSDAVTVAGNFNVNIHDTNAPDRMAAVIGTASTGTMINIGGLQNNINVEGSSDFAEGFFSGVKLADDSVTNITLKNTKDSYWQTHGIYDRDDKGFDLGANAVLNVSVEANGVQLGNTGGSEGVFGLLLTNAESTESITQAGSQLNVVVEGAGVSDAGLLGTVGISGSIKAAGDVMVDIKSENGIGLRALSAGDHSKYTGDVIVKTNKGTAVGVVGYNGSNEASIVIDPAAGKKVQLLGDVKHFTKYGTQGALIDISFKTADSFLEGASIGANGTNRVTNLSFDNASVWNMTGDSVVNALVNNNDATIDMTHGADTLTVSDYSGEDGNFIMDTDLNSQLNGDKITIVSAATGTTYVQVKDASLVNGVEVIGNKNLLLITDASENAKFAGKNLNAGGLWDVTPTIKNGLEAVDAAGNSVGSANEWYLTKLEKVINNDTETLLDAADSSYALWRNTNDSLRQRLGDLRYRNDKTDGDGIWARYTGGRFGSGDFAGRYNMYQLGYDKADNAKSTYGFAIDSGTGRSDYSFGSGKDKLWAGSLYGTWYGEGGSYTDVVARVGQFDTDIKSYGDYPDKANAKSHAYSLSVEYGKTIEVNKQAGTFIEPQVQFIAGSLGSSSYTTDRGNNVYLGGINSYIGRIGFIAGQKTPDGNDVYFKANVLKEFGGSNRDIHMLAANGENLSTSKDYADTWFELGLGANIKLGKTSHFYGDIERSFGADIQKKWQVNAGVRFEF